MQGHRYQCAGNSAITKGFIAKNVTYFSCRWIIILSDSKTISIIRNLLFIPRNEFSITSFLMQLKTQSKKQNSHQVNLLYCFADHNKITLCVCSEYLQLRRYEF